MEKITDDYAAKNLDEILLRYFIFLLHEGTMRAHAASTCKAIKRRYEQGSFGVCAKCRAKIDPVVLIFIPDQPYCPKCEAKASKRSLEKAGISRQPSLCMNFKNTHGNAYCLWA